MCRFIPAESLSHDFYYVSTETQAEKIKRGIINHFHDHVPSLSSGPSRCQPIALSNFYRLQGKLNAGLFTLFEVSLKLRSLIKGGTNDSNSHYGNLNKIK